MHYDTSGINDGRTTTGNLCTVSLVESTEKHSRMRRDKLDATIWQDRIKKVKMGNTGGTIGYLYLTTPLQSQILCYVTAGTFTRRESGDRSARTKQEDKGSECKSQRVT